jgi:hypothetical protein
VTLVVSETGAGFGVEGVGEGATDVVCGAELADVAARSGVFVAAVDVAHPTRSALPNTRARRLVVRGRDCMRTIS